MKKNKNTDKFKIILKICKYTCKQIRNHLLVQLTFARNLLTTCRRIGKKLF